MDRKRAQRVVWRAHVEEKRAMARVAIARLRRRVAEAELERTRRLAAARRRLADWYERLTRDLRE